MFGSGDETLSGVTASLLDQNDLSVSFVDFQFGSAAAKQLRDGMSDPQRSRLHTCIAIENDPPEQWVGDDSLAGDDILPAAAAKIREQSNSDIGIAIGPFIGDRREGHAKKFPVTISFAPEIGEPIENPTEIFRFAGHSSMRQIRSAYQVVDFLRRSLAHKFGS